MINSINKENWQKLNNDLSYIEENKKVIAKKCWIPKKKKGCK